MPLVSQWPHFATANRSGFEETAGRMVEIYIIIPMTRSMRWSRPTDASGRHVPPPSRMWHEEINR